MPPRRKSSIKRVTKQPKEAGHSRPQPPRDPVPAIRSPSPPSSSQRSPPPAPRADVVPSTEPTRRITRSSAKALLASAAISATVSSLHQPSEPKPREVDRSDQSPADTSAVREISNLHTVVLSPGQPVRPGSERPSAQRTGPDSSQPIRTWAAGIEGSAASQPSPYSSSDVAHEGFWKTRGYDLPDTSSASMSSSIDDGQQTQSQPLSRGTSTTRKQKSQKSQGTEKNVTTVTANDTRFATVLMEHNINFNTEPTPDDRLDDLRKLSRKKSPAGRAPENHDVVSQEARWRRDMLKCKVSNEAIFQRTIMMDIIERDGLGEKLDYMCEVQWTSERMPRRSQSLRLAQPKPDLAVSFRTASLLPPHWPLPSLTRLGNMLGHVVPESPKRGEIDRAFPFFSIEVKGKAGRIGNTEAEYQNLNTASQALYNIHVVMKEARQEEVFFREVRFFSVVATAAGFELRVHRPIKLMPDGDYIDPECGTRFGFDELLTFGSEYTRTTVSTIVYNILFHYGVVQLHPILKKALEVVLKNDRGVAAGLSLATLRQGREETNVQSQNARTKGKRTRDEGLAESFKSNTSSQRRRFTSLGVNDKNHGDGELLV